MVNRVLVLILVSVLLFGGLGLAKYRQITAMKAQFSQPQPPTQVAAATVETQRWGRSLFAVGSLSAVQDVHVMSEVPGQIAAIHFESGKEVHAGDVLVTLDASIDEAELRGHEALLRLADIQFQRAAELQRKHTMSRAQYDEAAARRAEADALVAAKRAYLAKKFIRAPITGTLGIRRIDLGDYLAPGSPVVTLQAMDPMFVDFRLPERFIARIAKDQTATLRVQARPDEVFTSHVTAIDPAVDVATRMVKVRAKLPNPEGKLRPGMFAEVNLVETTEDEVLVVPETAVTYSPYGSSVFVIERHDGGLKVNRRPITTGEVRAGWAAVSKGLSAGERVVAVGQNKLRNDLNVVIAASPVGAATGP